MPIPIVYRKSGEGIIATYNFIDVASGTGIISFYGSNSISGASMQYELSNWTRYSDDIYSFVDNPTGAYVKKMDIDFDVAINKPIVLKGNTIVNLPWAVISANNETTSAYVKAIVKKVSGLTETQLSTSQSGVLSLGVTGRTYKMDALNSTIEQVNLGAGDTLRLTIEGYIKDGNVSGGCAIGHDPKGRTNGWDATGACPSILTFYAPVRIDV